MSFRNESGEMRIVVTQAGQESLTLRKLLRKTLPVLKSPGSVSDTERRLLANAIHSALDDTSPDDEFGEEGESAWDN